MVLAGFAFFTPEPIYTNSYGTSHLCPDYLGKIWAVRSHTVPITGVGAPSAGCEIPAFGPVQKPRPSPRSKPPGPIPRRPGPVKER